MLIPFGILAASGGFGSDFDLIATQVVTSVNNLTFTSIPQDYKHLQIRFVAKSTNSTAPDISVQINGSLTNYGSWRVTGRGSSVAAQTSGTTAGAALYQSATTNTSTGYAAGIIDFPGYTATGRSKAFKAFYGSTDTPQQVAMAVGHNFSAGGNNAITELSLILSSGNFTGSRFSLYGIR